MADGATDLDMRQRFAVWRASGVGVTLSPEGVAQIEERLRQDQANRGELRGIVQAMRQEEARLRRELDEASARQRRIVGGAATLIMILLAGGMAAFAVGLGLGMVLGGV